MGEYLITIKNNGNNTYKYRKHLRSLGFSYNGRSWQIKTRNLNELKKIKHFCFFHKLKYEQIDAKYTRNSSYRNEYFSHYQPHLFNRYFCTYCGRLLKRRDAVVDHIIPVKKATSSIICRKFIDFMQWSGVNDYHNLCSSCFSCNQRKGAKTGLWVIRGYIGKLRIFQILRWILRTIIMLLLFRFLCQLL